MYKLEVLLNSIIGAVLCDDKGTVLKNSKAILSCFTDLEERLKNVPKECEACPETKHLKQKIADLEAENKALHCCGNCGKTICPWYKVHGQNVCDKWELAD